MKKYLLASLLGFVCNASFSQLNIKPGVHWVNSGATVIVLNDIDLMNNGIISKGSSVVKFTGINNNIIGGNVPVGFHELEIIKSPNSLIALSNNIDVAKRIIFTSGLLDLNKKDITLAESAYLHNETENSRITGTTGGEVIISLLLNAPVATNPGNMGAVITSAADMGTVVIRRGHKAESGSGMSGSINRYYNITPVNNAGLNATFRSYYFDAEMNTQSESLLKMFRSTNGGVSWANQNFNTRNINENYVEKSGVDGFSIWTLSSAGGALPVAGLEFNAKRISNDKVQLTWITKLEYNNKGFVMERKKENENDFNSIGFVNSLAPGGNSNAPLNYSKIDPNDFKGTTYYRLKQEDLNGQFIYSVIRSVNGSDATAPILKVWPIPSNGNVNVMVENIEKEVVQVFDISGRLVQQFPVINNVQHKISGLLAGSYLVRLAGQQGMVQKIIVQ